VIEVEEGSSDDEFESATSSPWLEEVGMYDPLDDPYSAGLIRPTPDSVMDATTAELRALQDSMRRANLEFHRTRRRACDLDGPGWKLFDQDIRGVGIEVYHLYSDEERVWRYKEYNTDWREKVSEPHDPNHCVEISVENLEAAAGWY
jgi:hypothetical protein